MGGIKGYKVLGVETSAGQTTSKRIGKINQLIIQICHKFTRQIKKKNCLSSRHTYGQTPVTLMGMVEYRLIYEGFLVILHDSLEQKQRQVVEPFAGQTSRILIAWMHQ